MATTVIKTVFQFRRAHTSEWEQNKTVVPAAGEPCFDLDLNTLKIGDGVKTYEELDAIGGAEIAADGKSIVYDGGVLKLVGFDAAETGAQPRKNAEGTIEWVVPSTDTVDGLQSTVAGLQSDVAALQAIVTPSGDGAQPLSDRVEALETQMDTLNGTGEGSIDKTVTDKINAFAEKISEDGNVNTFKELVDYVADHGGEAAKLAADIIALQNLVGETSVSDQITAMAVGKVDVEEGKGLSTNDFTDDLLTKLNDIADGAQVNVIESVKVGGTLLDVVEKGVDIPVATDTTLGVVKASEEITVAEDGTLGIGKISVSKLVQDEDTVLVFDGGSSK